MVNSRSRRGILAALLLLASSYAQTREDLENRVAELEQKIALLERRLNQLLPAEAPAAAAAKQLAPEAPRPALRPVSVAGDYQSAPDAETRLPVAGYMDFHVNKESGDSFRPDFHRFVLL